MVVNSRKLRATMTEHGNLALYKISEYKIKIQYLYAACIIESYALKCIPKVRMSVSTATAGAVPVPSRPYFSLVPTPAGKSLRICRYVNK